MSTLRIIRFLPLLTASVAVQSAGAAPLVRDVCAADGSTIVTLPSGYEISCPVGMRFVGAEETSKTSISTIRTSSSTAMSGGSDCPGPCSLSTASEFVVPGCVVQPKFVDLDPLGGIVVVDDLSPAGSGIEVLVSPDGYASPDITVQPETVILDPGLVDLEAVPSAQLAGAEFSVTGPEVEEQLPIIQPGSAPIFPVAATIVGPSVPDVEVLPSFDTEESQLVLSDVSVENIEALSPSGASSSSVLLKRSRYPADFPGAAYLPNPPYGTVAQPTPPSVPDLPKMPSISLHAGTPLAVEEKDRIKSVVPVESVKSIRGRDLSTSSCGCGSPMAIKQPIIAAPCGGEEVIERLVTKKTSTNCGTNCGCECALGPEISSVATDFEVFPAAPCPPAVVDIDPAVVEQPAPVVVEPVLPAAPACALPVAPCEAAVEVEVFAAPMEDILSRERFVQTSFSSNCPCGSDWHGECTESTSGVLAGEETIVADAPAIPAVPIVPALPPAATIEPVPVSSGPSTCDSGEELVESVYTRHFSSNCGDCEDQPCGCTAPVIVEPVAEECGEPFLVGEKYVRTLTSSNCPCTPGCGCEGLVSRACASAPTKTVTASAVTAATAAVVKEPAVETWWRPCGPKDVFLDGM